MNLSRRNLSILGAVILFLFLAIIIIPKIQSAIYQSKIAPDLEALERKDRVDALRDVELYENAARTTLAQIFGGLVLLAGLYFTYRNVRIAEEGKLTDRFSKAVEMLGSENLDVRLGGIYALERIARDSQKDHWTVMEVLTAFVREKAPYNPEQEEDSVEQTKSKMREDIQAIMTVIGRRKWTEMETQRLNLLRTDLRKCALEEANLSRARLSRANLSGVYWKHVDLHEATWFDANLDGAYLRLALNLTLNQTLHTKNFEKAKLPRQLEKELKEWQENRAKNTGAGADSSENQSGE